jgi:ubiquinone/menaquinone biosynthesis C-methylase UbiE
MTTDTIHTWDRYPGPPAAVYDRHFVPAIGLPFATRVVEPTTPRRGERVLDVGCGTGVVARLAADRVGTDGTVVGVDGHPGMLEVARAARSDIAWRQSSAEGLPFDDDSFDVALCSLALQFFAEKIRALGEMRRVVRPGGRVGIATTGPTPELFDALRDVLGEHLGDHVAAFVDAVFALDDPERLHELLAAAGFDDIETSRDTLQLRLDGPAEFFWQYALGTPLAEAVGRLDADSRARLEAAVVDRWERFVVDGGVVVDVGVVLGAATVGT